MSRCRNPRLLAPQFPRLLAVRYVGGHDAFTTSMNVMPLNGWWMSSLEPAVFRSTCLREVDVVHRVVRVYRDELQWKAQRQQRLASQATVIRVEGSVFADTSSADISHSSDHADRPVILSFAGHSDSASGESTSSAGSLSLNDGLIQAPSIGIKTSERLADIGILDVAEFLHRSPREIAYQLRIYWITAESVSQWQAQANLMCEVSELRCRDAQLLAGAGLRKRQSNRELRSRNTSSRSLVVRHHVGRASIPTRRLTTQVQRSETVDRQGF